MNAYETAADKFRLLKQKSQQYSKIDGIYFMSGVLPTAIPMGVLVYNLNTNKLVFGTGAGYSTVTSS